MPPKISVVTTTQGENSTVLIKSWNTAPRAAAGRNAIMTAHANRLAPGSAGRPTITFDNLGTENAITARIAPSWMTTSNSLPKSF
jgi:hypothetical protein